MNKNKLTVSGQARIYRDGRILLTYPLATPPRTYVDPAVAQ